MKEKCAMDIIHVASELAPCAKEGGLADVLLGLSRETKAQGNSVEIIIPKYDCLDYSTIEDLVVYDSEVMTTFGDKAYKSVVWRGVVEEMTVYFIDPHHPADFFSRGEVYGCDDDFERFAFFSRAVLDFVKKRGKTPDIFHLHDWQTALIAPLYKQVYSPGGLEGARCAFTIHNIAYQGWGSFETLRAIGIEDVSTCKDDNHDCANAMRSAILYADVVNTVSPTYAHEVRTTEGGRGLEGILHKHNGKFRGILNGIDERYWNPAKDPFVPVSYSSRTRSRKQDNKRILRDHFSLAQKDAPLVASVTRLAPQKGIDMITHALYHTLEMGGQFILLGSTHIPEIEEEFTALKEKYASHPDVHIELSHHESLAHLIYAGADIIIVPSVFEPCGLTQMIGLRYGTIPVVRHTGGLVDTVFDIDYSERAVKDRNGFVFNDLNMQGIDSALNRAITMWFEDRKGWDTLVGRVMRCDYCWKASAKIYLEAYDLIRSGSDSLSLAHA
jgi:starch synthase